jgi:hypothetical protein
MMAAAFHELSNWRDLLRQRIIQRLPTGNDAEVERRLQAVLDFEVPTDAELIAMQDRGELPSDEELARIKP